MITNKERKEMEDDEQERILLEWANSHRGRDCFSVILFVVFNGVFWIKTAMEILA